MKSPAKRTTSDLEEEIPSSQQPPAPKRQKTEEGFRTLGKKIASLKTRRAKSLKSLSVVKEHASKRSCPIGLQFRPRPHIRRYPEFTEQDLLKPQNRTRPPQALYQAAGEKRQRRFPDHIQSKSLALCPVS